MSHLLKSNCLVTGQPDWGSVQIHYVGPQIDQEGLLQYLIGFREHNEFHEQCVERIFIDILRQCAPQKAGGVRALHPPRRPRHQPLAHQLHRPAPAQPAHRAPVSAIGRRRVQPRGLCDFGTHACSTVLTS